VAGLNNRVPTEVLLLELIGTAIAMFLLGLHVGVLGRGAFPALLAAGTVAMLLYVTFDLDRPTRGLIRVPDTPISELRDSMNQAPATG
jgi:TctA family transporter